MKAKIKLLLLLLFFMMFYVSSQPMITHAYESNFQKNQSMFFNKEENKENSTYSLLNPNMGVLDGGSGQGTVYTKISLNTLNDVTFTPNQVKYFKYTPETNAYFVIETTGNLDTKIQIQSTSIGTIVDDNSGIGLNAKVEFFGTQNEQIFISIKLSDSSADGSIQFQLRKQRFSMFGYDDGAGKSTIPDLTVPFETFNEIFETIKYENTSASHALLNDNRNLSRINSEIMFFSGHGYKNSETNKGFGVAFKSGDITTITPLNMDRTKVAVWAACFSANSTNTKNMSIAEYSVNCGAKSAVGFVNSVSFGSSKLFTNRFFEKLSTGATVIESAKYGAKGILWPWDAAKDYVIFGDGNIKVIEVTQSTSTFNSRNLNFDISKELNDSYACYQIDENTFRYYETINGYLTNSFVDLEYDDNNFLINVADYRKMSEIIYPIVEDYIDMSISNTLELENKIFNVVSIDSNNVIYHIINNEYIPIEIRMVTYKCEDLIIQIPICVNLSNGQYINYSTINSIDN